MALGFCHLSSIILLPLNGLLVPFYPKECDTMAENGVGVSAASEREKSTILFVIRRYNYSWQQSIV
jgi:hypothetical protein